MPTNPRGGQWRPYRFEPVLYPDVDLRMTYQHRGDVVGATLFLGDREFDFTVTPTAVEVIVTRDEIKGIPDRAPAGVNVRVRNGDGAEDEVELLRGHVVRSRA